LVHGSTKSITVPPIANSQKRVLGKKDMAGKMKKKYQSKGVFIGNLFRFAGGALVAGIVIDKANNIMNTEIVITFGGIRMGREHLITCTPIKIIIATGKPRCIRCRRKKIILFRVSLLRKDMGRGSIRRGISLKSSDVLKAMSCALSSQTSQYPVIPSMIEKMKSTIPENQASHLLCLYLS